MYFENRAQAGLQLAGKLLEKYRFEDCAVIALSDGAVLVGEQIATALHCSLSMLLIEEIRIPGEDANFGAMSQNGTFTYNGMISAGEMEEYLTEYHGYFDEQKRSTFQKINRLLGDGGIIDNELLRDRTIILVSDGLENGASIEVALEFLKPIRINRLIVATPTASIQAVDRLHILADELHILDVKENFMGVNHYFDQNVIPSHEETIAKINHIVLNWR